MGRNRRTQKPPILMDGSPTRTPYQRPAGSVLAPWALEPVTLHRAGEPGFEHDQVLHIQAWEYRNKIVDFRLMHTAIVDGEEVHIARIDCCNGSVHRHTFDRSGRALVDHEPIQELWQEDDVWETVDALYPVCWDMIVDQVEDNYRRWKS